MAGDTTQHPVWDVYDQHRTARLNVKYHSALLLRLQRLNFVVEILLAVTAPSSVIAALWFWDTTYGTYVWKFLGVVTALLAVAKPVLRLTEKIRALEEVLSGYRALDHDLQNLSILIRQAKKYDTKLQRRFRECMDKKGALIARNVVLAEKPKLKERCQAEVLRELPFEVFYLPKEQ